MLYVCMCTSALLFMGRWRGTQVVSGIHSMYRVKVPSWQFVRAAGRCAGGDGSFCQMPDSHSRLGMHFVVGNVFVWAATERSYAHMIQPVVCKVCKLWAPWNRMKLWDSDVPCGMDVQGLCVNHISMHSCVI